MLNRRQVLMVGALACASGVFPLRVRAGTIYPLKATAGGRLLIAAQVNGHDVDALLDSAAEASFLDSDVAQKIGLVSAGSVGAKGSGEKNFSVPLAKGVTLSAAGITMRDQTIAVSSLADVGKRLLGHPLNMILGREIFDAARLRIDIGRGQIEVLDDKTEPLGTRLATKTVNGIEVFPLRVEGEETLAALDIGNGSGVLVGAPYAKRRGFLTDGRAVTEAKGGGLGGETNRKVFALKTLEVAGVTLKDLAGSIDPGDSATDLNVGISVLKHFVITTDFRAHALWLDPVKS